MTQPSTQPLISIIMPTYNRARFLKDAFASIKSQQCTDWELIVVDDGSTDDTKEIIEREFASIEQPTRYIYQENQGAYVARNTGLENMCGKYVAFYDSDDQWLPHHLQDCAEALESNPELDWVNGALKRVRLNNSEVTVDNSFYIDGQPRQVLKLKKKQIGSLCIVEDDRLLESMLRNGGLSGLQCALIRANVFADEHFQADFRNIEDQLYTIRAVSRGFVFGYFDNIHLTYIIHDDNSSAAREGVSAAYQEKISLTLLRGYSLLKDQLILTQQESKALNEKLASISFWRLGYSVYWSQNNKQKAFEYFRKGIRLRPFYLPFRKTYLVSKLKYALGF